MFIFDPIRERMKYGRWSLPEVVMNECVVDGCDATSQCWVVEIMKHCTPSFKRVSAVNEDNDRMRTIWHIISFRW